MKKAIFPGSFDPLTNGHLDLIKRSSNMFDEVLVTVAQNTKKIGMFSAEERVKLIQPNISSLKNVKVCSSNDLTVHFAKVNGAKFIIRGLRDAKDLASERSIADMNRQLDKSIDTIFFITAPEYQSISSSIIKEIAYFDGNITKFVPENVAESIKKKLKR